MTAVKKTEKEVFHAFPTVNDILRIVEHTVEGFRETEVFYLSIQEKYILTE